MFVLTNQTLRREVEMFFFYNSTNIALFEAQAFVPVLSTKKGIGIEYFKEGSSEVYQVLKTVFLFHLHFQFLFQLNILYGSSDIFLKFTV